MLDIEVDLNIDIDLTCRGSHRRRCRRIHRRRHET